MEDYMELVEKIVRRVLEICREGITLTQAMESISTLYNMGRMKIYGLLMAMYNMDLIDIKVYGKTFYIIAKTFDEEKIKKFVEKNYRWLIN